MNTIRRTRCLSAATLLILPAAAAFAQLPPPNPAGVSTGHVHLTVPDLDSHKAIWTSLGGVEKSSGVLSVIEFPGIYVVLTEGEPAASSIETSANHIGFSVLDYSVYRDRLESAGATFFYESEEDGQLLADLPDGVRIEILTDAEQSDPIVFHHMHLSTPDTAGLRDWYLEVLGAEAGERRGLPSAVIPGGRVDFLPAQSAPLASRGAAIDHIGFEVRDLNAFASEMETLGIAFDLGPLTVDAINLKIAFITDPAGTFIEITEGLAAVE
jgi:catechol 2,3-dioxygenase-like lactoylglutathione lyase family enzyme